MKSAGISRVSSFDNVRALAVICMIISHVSLMLGSADACATPVGRFMNDFCGTAPAAPVFMLLMGIFFVFPHDRSLSVKVFRGLKLFLLGIMLNFLRMVIPFYILSINAPEMFDGMVTALQVGRDVVFWRILYNVDILGFAGVAYIILALLQHLLTRSWQWISVGAVMIFAAPYLWGAGESLGIAFYPLQPLWGRAFVMGAPTDTAFPVFPWLVFPIMGLLIGRLLKSDVPESEIAAGMTRFGLLFAILGAAFVSVYGTGQFGDYYRMYAGGTFLVMSFALLWTAMFMRLTLKGYMGWASSVLTFWSENLTLIYCVQWFWFGFSILLPYFRRVDSPIVLMAVTPVFFLLTWGFTRLLLFSPRFIGIFRWFTR